ncbi:unnamed protein product [Rotaria sordida]|uniref:Nose resistant-to-fluoxetine protein N-terminal domain-containing protein n=1 Tax=Rotaria sordida TaxID=392033 RepID=A0A815C6E0_9BILA|nr:unnamed protein product [Rotaria sordida]CAF1558571.1 unnamed protein product [Rotaria sordida]
MLSFISLSSKSNTTTKCEQDFVLLVESALRRELWALKILDSWGKPLPSGLLKGNNLWVGNYDECLDPLYQHDNKTFLKQTFDGHYCALLPRGMKPQQTMAYGLILGICVPSSCDRQSTVSLVQINIHDMCLDASWYLYNDMQFHWIAPLALIPFVIGRKPIAFIVATLFVLVGIGSILGILLYYPNMEVNRITAAMQTTGPTFYEKIYLTPWCRISPYAIGLLTGFIVINTGRSYRLNIYTKIFGSLLATVFGLTCIFVMYPDYAFVSGLSRSAIIAYQALSRSFWALVIGWLLFLCSTNQGGIVNTILSWPIWSPLARLNYSAYLVHTIILFITIYNQTIPYYFQPHLIINSYISNLFFIYVAAIVGVIFFETPFVVLEKKLFKR